MRRRTGFQFLILLFRDSRGPVRSRNGRHYLGRDSGDQRSRCHPENPASGGTFHGILAHGGAGGYLGQLSVRLAGGEEMQVVDTEQIYTGAQGIKAKIPAGYTLLEETVQPETDETYAYYGFDTYNDRIGYSLGKVVDMIPEEITSVDEISDHCAQRDSAFYTGGFIAPTQRTEIGGREMLCSEGYITENPELVYAVYDMLYEGSLVTATFRYGKKDYGKRETRLRIESLLKGIELE